jgi:hypothetical protein
MSALMRRLRHLLLVALGVAAICGFASQRAFAAPPLPSSTPALPQTVTSAHFTVSYEDDSTKPDYINQAQAGDVLATAERAYASYAASGFPTPAVRGSGKTELYVVDLSQWGLSAIYCNGSVVEDTATVTGDQMAFSVSSDVFTQVERKIANPDNWLVNGTSAWAAWRALGYPAQSTADIGPFEMSLDCDSAPDRANCSKVGYENLGGSRWPFYEYLTEKFGPLVIVDIVTAAGAAGGSGLAGLQNALAAHGSSLATEYAAFATKMTSAGWTATQLNVAVPPISGLAVHAGAATGNTTPQSFGVNHLAMRFVEIDRGDGDAGHACYAATLTIHVEIPNGATSQPTFYWNGIGNAPVPLTVSGSSATAAIPWDTCAWQNKGLLSLPNTSVTADGASFVVWTHLDVDTTTSATATPPPAPASIFGQVVDAGTASTVPNIDIFGPQLLRLSATDTQIRLIVHSSAEGSVTATMGSRTLGTASVRPGGNDLRFKLPTSLLARLRRSSSTNVLTLTPTSLDGKVTGAAITRAVAFTPRLAKVVKPKKKVTRSK